MRRVETFVGAAGLLELIESPKLSPLLPATKRQRAGSKEYGNEDLEEALHLAHSVDSDLMQEMSAFELSPLLLPRAVTTETLPAMNLDALHPSNLLMPGTADIMAQELDMNVPLSLAGPVLDRKSKGAKSASKPAAKSDTELSPMGADHQSWQSKLREVMSNGSDAFTRALLVGALTADGPGTIHVLARLSPRQIDALKPEAVAILVRDQVELTRNEMMRSVLGVSGICQRRSTGNASAAAGAEIGMVAAQGLVAGTRGFKACFHYP